MKPVSSGRVDLRVQRLADAADRQFEAELRAQIDGAVAHLTRAAPSVSLLVATRAGDRAGLRALEPRAKRLVVRAMKQRFGEQPHGVSVLPTRILHQQYLSLVLYAPAALVPDATGRRRVIAPQQSEEVVLRTLRQHLTDHALELRRKTGFIPLPDARLFLEPRDDARERLLLEKALRGLLGQRHGAAARWKIALPKKLTRVAWSPAD